MLDLRAFFTQSETYRASFSQLANDAVLLPRWRLQLGATSGLNVDVLMIAVMIGSNYCCSELGHQNAGSLSRRQEASFCHQFACASLAKAR